MARPDFEAMTLDEMDAWRAEQKALARRAIARRMGSGGPPTIFGGARMSLAGRETR